MTPRTLLATAAIPGGGELRLMRRGADHMILLDRNELMTSRTSGSEEALATLTLDRVAAPAPRVLIGGYGMGFTLRAALGVLGPAARVRVVELVPDILDWARGPMAELTAGCLDDRRVKLTIGDVADAIAGEAGTLDAILLDVDNGPDGIVRRGNDRLYRPRGLAVARAALRPGGVLAVWSAAPDAAFRRRLEVEFAVEEVVVPARANGKGPRHIIWFARKG